MLPQFNKTPLIKEALKLLKDNIPEKDLFYNHSLRTALLLQKMQADEPTIISGILHHIPENKLTGKASEIIKKANKLKPLCEPQKNLKAVPLKKWQKTLLNERAENLRRMFFALSHDIRPIFLTLACRFDTIANLSKEYETQKRINHSIIALEILSPLAYGLGLTELKGKLEDLVFPIIYNKEYSWLLKNVKEKYKEREEYLQQIMPKVKEVLDKENIPILNIASRAKHYFSLYQKMLRHDMNIEKIYDLVALRITTDNIEHCYLTLGILHKIWPPIAGRIKDYIAHPKTNGYRALHTTVVCQKNKILEIQINTKTMRQEAEIGAAAHFRYKQIKNKPSFKDCGRQKSHWLDELRKWQKESQDTNKTIRFFPSDLFKNRIFVFTPRKDIINLPKDSTAIDFAFALHSQIGQRCSGAKINGKMASLKQTLKTGDVVEVLTSKDKKPSRDWLMIAKTKKARQKIQKALENIYDFSFVKPGKTIKEKISLVKKILPAKKAKKATVEISGQTGIAFKTAQCCQPQNTDVIAGFVSQGEPVSLHKTNCKVFLKQKEKNPQRVVSAKWL